MPCTPRSTTNLGRCSSNEEAIVLYMQRKLPQFFRCALLIPSQHSTTHNVNKSTQQPFGYPQQQPSSEPQTALQRLVVRSLGQLPSFSPQPPSYEVGEPVPTASILASMPI